MQSRGEHYLWAAVSYSASCSPVSITGNELHRAPSSDLRASMLLVITLLGRLFDLLQLWSFCSFLKKHDAFSLARHLVVGRE